MPWIFASTRRCTKNFSPKLTRSNVFRNLRVERLLICLSQPREPALEWNLAGASSGQFAARRLSVAEQAQAGLPAGGETWELVLKLARSGPFESCAIRSVAFRQETPVALASVADATTQRGTLTVRALGDSGLAIKNRRLMSACQPNCWKPTDIKPSAPRITTSQLATIWGLSRQ